MVRRRAMTSPTADASAEWIGISVAHCEQPMRAYLARPRAPGRYPVCIVCFELFGLTRHIRNVTDRIARLGYVAVAPDLYHRTVPGAELTYDEAGRQAGFANLRRMSRETAIADVRATFEAMRAAPYSNGRIGLVGFSLGGHVGYLAATALDLRTVVAFYPGWLTSTDVPLSMPSPTIDLTAGIREHNGRVMLVFGDRDHVITVEQITEIEKALASNKVRHEIVVLPGAPHGFFCDERPSYDEVASGRAWSRTVAALADALTG
jgi:carboxymethylenebutenolidase